MVCEVQYGGRITDDLDRELFNAYGDDYIRDNVFSNDVVLTKCPKEGSKENIEYKMLSATHA
jgi:dynein heavy chain